MALTELSGVTAATWLTPMSSKALLGEARLSWCNQTDSVWQDFTLPDLSGVPEYMGGGSRSSPGCPQPGGSCTCVARAPCASLHALCCWCRRCQIIGKPTPATYTLCCSYVAARKWLGKVYVAGVSFLMIWLLRHRPMLQQGSGWEKSMSQV